MPSAQYNGTSGMGVPIVDLHSVVNKATKCAGQTTVLFIAPMIDSIHTYTLLLLHPFNSLFCRTTWVSQYQKGKTRLDFNEARDDGVLGCIGISWTICKQSAPRCRQITTPTPHHSIFTVQMLFLMPIQRCQIIEGTRFTQKHTHTLLTTLFPGLPG